MSIKRISAAEADLATAQRLAAEDEARQAAAIHAVNRDRWLVAMLAVMRLVGEPGVKVGDALKVLWEMGKEQFPECFDEQGMAKGEMMRGPNRVLDRLQEGTW